MGVLDESSHQPERGTRQSPIVVFALVPNGENGNFLFAKDAKECHVASLAEGNHQFPLEGVFAHPTASEGVAFKDPEFGKDCIDRPKRKIEISRLHCSPFEELLQALQIVPCFACQQDPPGHGELTALLRFRASIRLWSLLRIPSRTSEAG
jgi:hypothetical protein